MRLKKNQNWISNFIGFHNTPIQLTAYISDSINYKNHYSDTYSKHIHILTQIRKNYVLSLGTNDSV